MKLFLARLTLNQRRLALGWAGNPYRVHQRLMMAYEGDPRLLFRLEQDEEAPPVILVQSHREPDFERAFGSFAVLSRPPELKPFEVQLAAGSWLRFRLLANPTVKREGARLGLLQEEEQRAWLERKLAQGGAALAGCTVQARGLRTSSRGPAKEENQPVHLAVLFEGLLAVKDPAALTEVLANGIGPAKGFGFGLLSLAPGAFQNA